MGTVILFILSISFIIRSMAASSILYSPENTPGADPQSLSSRAPEAWKINCCYDWLTSSFEGRYTSIGLGHDFIHYKRHYNSFFNYISFHIWRPIMMDLGGGVSQWWIRAWWWSMNHKYTLLQWFLPSQPPKSVVAVLHVCLLRIFLFLFIWTFNKRGISNLIDMWLTFLISDLYRDNVFNPEAEADKWSPFYLKVVLAD